MPLQKALQKLFTKLYQILKIPQNCQNSQLLFPAQSIQTSDQTLLLRSPGVSPDPRTRPIILRRPFTNSPVVKNLFFLYNRLHVYLIFFCDTVAFILENRTWTSDRMMFFTLVSHSSCALTLTLSDPDPAIQIWASTIGLMRELYKILKIFPPAPGPMLLGQLIFDSHTP